MTASLCAAARRHQGIEPLRSRCCVVFGEIPHLTLLLKTVHDLRERGISHTPKTTANPSRGMWCMRPTLYLRRYEGIGNWVGRMPLAACLLMGLPSFLVCGIVHLPSEGSAGPSDSNSQFGAEEEGRKTSHDMSSLQPAGAAGATAQQRCHGGEGSRLD